MVIKKIILVGVVLGWVGCAAVTPPPQVTALAGGIPKNCLDKTHIVLLGTGTPNTDPHRHGPSLAIVVKGKPYIVDCGPGLVRRAAAAYRAGVTALRVKDLKTAFITHLHSDHTVGYPDLIFSPWVMGRDEPLKVYGTPGTVAMTRHLLEAYREDIRVRLNGLEPATAEGYKVEAVDCRPGLIYEDQNVKVRAFAARHGAWKHAFGFYFVTPEVKICVSGDTTPYPEMVDNYRGCDILIHEVYCQKGFEARPPKWQAYHAASHTSAVELGKIAALLQPRLLVLVHQLLWSGTEEQLLAEIRQHFDGPILYGRDLTFIGLPPNFSSGDRETSNFVILSLPQ